LDNIFIVGNKKEADELSFESNQKLALLNQTTLSVDDTKELIDYICEKYPDIQLPGFSDICYATTNRQNAVKEAVSESDALIIIGSQNSSNSQKLKLIGEKQGIPSILIDNKDELPDNFLKGKKSVAISSGASAPDTLVQELIEHLQNLGGIFQKEIITAEEKMIFPYTLKFEE